MALSYTPYRLPSQRLAHEWLMGALWTVDSAGYYVSHDPRLCLLGRCDLEMAVELQRSIEDEEEEKC